MYDLVPAEDGVPRLVEAATSACASGAVISGGDSVDWRDELGEGEALAAMTTAATLSSESFYPQKQVSPPPPTPHPEPKPDLDLNPNPNLSPHPHPLPPTLTQGNMAVGNAFTLSSGPGSVPLLLELGLKEAAERVRAKLVYDLDESGAAPQMRLRRVAIVREASGSDAAAADAGLGRPGTGLYDVPAGDKEKYCSLYCEGGLTLVCPFVLPLAPDDEARGCISLDWTGAKMRYQADRKFGVLDGSLSTFELTEILSTDSQDYPPDFKGYDRG